jgi:hypothetical protein
LFLYRTTVEAQLQRDPNKLADVLRVLEIERETWRKVCEQLGSSRLPAIAIPAPHAGAVTNRLSLEA